MKTVKRVSLNECEDFEEIRFMVSSKNCMGCQDTNSDVMFAVDSIKDGNLDIKQIFMSNEETRELINKLEKVLKQNEFTETD